jgi:hypothetical protein
MRPEPATQSPGVAKVAAVVVAFALAGAAYLLFQSSREAPMPRTPDKTFYLKYLGETPVTGAFASEPPTVGDRKLKFGSEYAMVIWVACDGPERILFSVEDKSGTEWASSEWPVSGNIHAIRLTRGYDKAVADLRLVVIGFTGTEYGTWPIKVIPPPKVIIPDQAKVDVGRGTVTAIEPDKAILTLTKPPGKDEFYEASVLRESFAAFSQPHSLVGVVKKDGTCTVDIPHISSSKRVLVLIEHYRLVPLSETVVIPIKDIVPLQNGRSSVNFANAVPTPSNGTNVNLKTDLQGDVSTSDHITISARHEADFTLALRGRFSVTSARVDPLDLRALGISKLTLQGYGAKDISVLPKGMAVSPSSVKPRGLTIHFQSVGEHLESSEQLMLPVAVHLMPMETSTPTPPTSGSR